MTLRSAIKNVKVSDIEIYDLAKKCGSLPLTGFEKEETKTIGILMVPCGFIDNGKVSLLTHPEELEKANILGIKEMKVQVIEGLNANGVPRIMNYQRLLGNKKDYARVAKMVEYLDDYLTTNDYGKEWAKLIPGEKTRDKIGELVGYKGTMVQYIKNVNIYAPELLDLMDNGTIRPETAATQAKKIKNETEGKSSKKVSNKASLKVVPKDVPVPEWFALDSSDTERLAEELIDYQQKGTIIMVGFENSRPVIKIDTKAGDNTITIFPQPFAADNELSVAA